MGGGRRFALVVWFFVLAGLVGFQVGAGFVSVLAVFGQVGKVLPDSGAAGAIAEEIFSSNNTASLVALPFLLLAVRPLFRLVGTSCLKKSVMTLLAIATVMVLVETFHLTPAIHELREQLGAKYGSVSLAPKDDPMRARFGMLHGISSVMALVTVIVETAAFVAAAWQALGRIVVSDMPPADPTV